MKHDFEKDIWYEEGEQIYVTYTVVRPDGTARYQETRLNNLKEAMPQGDASEISYGTAGLPTSKTWHKAGEEHRIGSPSSVIFHGNSDLPMTECFKVEGNPISSEDGPWRVRRRKDGDIWQEEYADSENLVQKIRPRRKLEP